MTILRIILITGVSGVGKTETLKVISKLLSSSEATFYHFDDIGIPSVNDMINEYGSVEAWQEAMVHAWMSRLSSETGFIFLEGSFNPKFAYEAQMAKWVPFTLFCLDCDCKTREARLLKERDQPELVTQDMENYAEVLRTETQKLGGFILDTGTLSPSQAANKILEHIHDFKPVP